MIWLCACLGGLACPPLSGAAPRFEAGKPVLPKAAAGIQAEQWKTVEITLTSLKTYTNPVVDVDVTATFDGPQGAVITRPAFWDGGNVWKVRFAPTMVGTWNYSTVSTDPANTGLHQQSGSVQASSYSGSLAIYKKGFLKVSPSRRYMIYGDGTPFFWLGDTHWQMPDYERDDECNYGDKCGSQFKHAVRDRMQKGFTVYQTYLDAGLNDGGGNVRVANWWSVPFTQLNPAAFKKYFDPKMEYLAENGFVVALGCGVHYKTTEAVGLAGLKLLAKYMVARYGSYPIVWITAQEVDINPDELAIWKEVAQTMDANDGYKHPLTGHMSFNKYVWGGETWHTWFAVQGGHGPTRTYQNQSFYKGFWDYSPTQPFLEAESKYEDVECGGLNDAVDERVVAYKSMQSGSLGFTYGVSGVWAMKWDVKVPGWDDYSYYPWYVGIDAPGSTFMKYLKLFYTSFAWERLVPRFGDNAWCAFANPETSVLSSASDAGRYVVYFYGSDTATGTLKKMDGSRTYIARWVDPRTGRNSLISNSINPSGGNWAIPPKPDGNDWLLLVEDVNAESALPEGDAPPVSQFKTATISSSSSPTNGGAQAVDNAARSYWCASSGAFPQWLSVDLGKAYSLSAIQTGFYASETWKYKIEGSPSGSGDWSMLADRTGAGMEGYRMNDTVSGSFRYIRISVTGSSQDWAAIREFKVFEKPAVSATNPILKPMVRPAISVLAAQRNRLQLAFGSMGPTLFFVKMCTLHGRSVLAYSGISGGARPNIAEVPLQGITSGDYYLEVMAGRAAFRHRIMVR